MNDQPTILIKTPPAPKRAPQRPWGDIMTRLRAEHPGEWAMVATDVPASIASYLRHNYGVETRTAGVKQGRAAELYVRWVPGVSFLPKRAAARERKAQEQYEADLRAIAALKAEQQ